MIDSSEERNRIAQTTGAVAVDMETEFIARSCAEHGVPLVSLRVISDTPRHPLPAPPNVLFDLDEQRTNFGRLAFYVAKNPTAIWRLISFARGLEEHASDYPMQSSRLFANCLRRPTGDDTARVRS